MKYFLGKIIINKNTYENNCEPVQINNLFSFPICKYPITMEWKNFCDITLSTELSF